MSSFGGPGGGQPAPRPIPPQRGSFPLDHAGECRNQMQKYLSCIQKVKGRNEDQCRKLSKEYLSCRMDKNLMARDELKNLGFAETGVVKTEVKGELQW